MSAPCGKDFRKAPAVWGSGVVGEGAAGLEVIMGLIDACSIWPKATKVRTQSCGDYKSGGDE